MDIEEYSKKVRQFYDEKIPVLLEKYLKESHWHDYLDCGCGDGSLLYGLKAHHMFEKKNIFAVDLSKNRINLVKKIDPSIHAFVDNAEELKTIKDGSIDFLASTQVIEHVDDKKMISTVFRVLRKGGVAYIVTIYKKWYGFYFYRNNGNWLLDPTHLREYTEDQQLFNLIDGNVFEILENQKTILRFPLVHAFLKFLKIEDRQIYKNKILYFLKNITIPIPGYYEWEIVLRKK